MLKPFYPISSDYKYEPAYHNVAVPTGEFRFPKKGEWFLSGSIIEAYLAPNNLTSAYYIARLVPRAMFRDKKDG